MLYYEERIQQAKLERSRNNSDAAEPTSNLQEQVERSLARAVEGPEDEAALLSDVSHEDETNEFGDETSCTDSSDGDESPCLHRPSRQVARQGLVQRRLDDAAMRMEDDDYFNARVSG
ncbi:MAG: hypothetical protein MHM6MM_009689 [Cercozoa sp. M6MM]